MIQKQDNKLGRRKNTMAETTLKQGKKQQFMNYKSKKSQYIISLFAKIILVSVHVNSFSGLFHYIVSCVICCFLWKLHVQLFSLKSCSVIGRHCCMCVL